MNPEVIPKEIVQLFRERTGLKITYRDAWDAKEKCLVKLFGKPTDYFKRVASFYQLMATANNGASVFETLDGRFNRAFFALGQSIASIEHSLPVLYLDGTHGRMALCGFTFLTASVQGWALVRIENIDNWSWFLHQLVQCTPNVAWQRFS